MKNREIEWYAEHKALIISNIVKHRMERKVIVEHLSEIERTGEWDAYEGRIAFRDRRHLRDLAERILYWDYEKNMPKRGLLKQYINSLKRLLVSIKAHESRQEQVDFHAIRAIPLDVVLRKYSVEFKGNMCNCPIHLEDTPSCHLYWKTNSWYCFGCHKGGSVIDLVQGIESCDLSQAINILKVM